MAENYRSMDNFEKEGGIIDREDQLLESFGESELDLGVFSNSENGKSAQQGPNCKRKTSLKGQGYRKKHVYTKSIAKYRKERARRKRVCELSNLNQEEIAKRLGLVFGRCSGIKLKLSRTIWGSLTGFAESFVKRKCGSITKPLSHCLCRKELSY